MRNKRKKNMHGLRFGKLVVVSEAPSVKGNAAWICQCDCGRMTTVLGASLRSGNTKSCGCLQKERTIANSKLRTKHGLCGTHVYRIWLHIKDRCLNEKNKNYASYGGRGIAICDEWKEDCEAFYNYVSKLPHFEEKGYSLDRIDNNGNYEPNNVKWSTAKEQGNNKRTNRIVEAFGEKHTVTEWSEITGIKYRTLMARLNRGSTAEEALSKEVKKCL